MRYFNPAFWLLLLVGCESATTQTKTEAPTTAPAAVADSTTFPLAWEPPRSTDTLLTLNGRRYHLRLQSEMDSTQRLRTAYEATPGHIEHEQGYEAWFTFTLRDSLNRPVFRTRLRKADFYQQVGAMVVVPSGVDVPTLLGYSAPLGALLFTLGFAVPGTDWGGEAVLLLDLHGRVQRLADGDSYGGGPDSRPALSRDGRTLLTAHALVRAHQPDLDLDKPHAELVGAFLLTDTTVATVYEPGSWQKVRTAQGTQEIEFVVSPAQEKACNGFVLHTRTGRELSRFRYKGYIDALGYTVPRQYVAATHTLYLIDEAVGLWPLALAAPTRPPVGIPFARMAKFVAPPRPTEARFEIGLGDQRYALYVDTLAPRHFRRQLLSE